MTLVEKLRVCVMEIRHSNIDNRAHFSKDINEISGKLKEWALRMKKVLKTIKLFRAGAKKMPTRTTCLSVESYLIVY